MEDRYVHPFIEDIGDVVSLAQRTRKRPCEISVLVRLHDRIRFTDDDGDWEIVVRKIEGGRE